MKPFQLLAKRIAKSVLCLEKQKIGFKLEYHYFMAQLCEEQIIANRVRLEAMEAY